MTGHLLRKEFLHAKVAVYLVTSCSLFHHIKVDHFLRPSQDTDRALATCDSTAKTLFAQDERKMCKIQVICYD